MNAIWVWEQSRALSRRATEAGDIAMALATGCEVHPLRLAELADSLEYMTARIREELEEEADE